MYVALLESVELCNPLEANRFVNIIYAYICMFCLFTLLQIIWLHFVLISALLLYSCSIWHSVCVNKCLLVERRICVTYFRFIVLAFNMYQLCFCICLFALCWHFNGHVEFISSRTIFGIHGSCIITSLYLKFFNLLKSSLCMVCM